MWRAGGGPRAARDTRAAASCSLNCAISSSIDRAISAPPGTRVHVASTPSRRSFVAESPASSTERLDPRGASFTGGPPRPKPRVLCMPAAAGGDRRERLARHRIPGRRPRPSPRLTIRARSRASPRRAMPAPGSAAAAPSPTLWTMRRACQGRSSRSCSGNAAGSAASLERLDGEHGRRGVMTVRERGLRGEPRDDHVGAELADHAHDVAEDGLPGPRRSASPRRSSSSRKSFAR